MNINKEIIDRLRQLPVNINTIGTESLLGNSWIDNKKAEIDKAETDNTFILGESGDSLSDLNEL
jgi:protein gp37